MKPNFWLERWERDQIGFHQAEHNKLLVDFWPQLNLPMGAEVFVPLCGKSLDMRWLEQAGHRVVGVELSERAISDYFADASEQPSHNIVDRFTEHAGLQTRLLHGDFFDLTAPLLDNVQGLFDRGALVALPPSMRLRYVDHLLRIVPDGCRILLLSFEYDQNLVDGPPHAVGEDEILEHYGARCEVRLLESFVTSQLPPHFLANGISQAVESVYLITKQE